MTTSPKETVLVTGASSGIGLHLARTFAQHGHNVIVVAPDAAELENVAREIAAEFDRQVTPLAVDLRESDKLDAALRPFVGRVGILCNNAGLGMGGLFQDISLEKHLEILKVNVEAVLRLTAIFLPAMIQRGSGRILNTASIAGFEPGPLMASYHASKAYVLSLTESLATENEKTGVTFTALCPGPVDTDFFAKADLENSVAFQKGNLMAPEDVAAAAYDAVMAGKRTVVPGAMNKANVLSSRFTSKAAQAKMSQKLYEDADEHKRDRGDKEMAATKASQD